MHKPKIFEVDNFYVIEEEPGTFAVYKNNIFPIMQVSFTFVENPEYAKKRAIALCIKRAENETNEEKNYKVHPKIDNLLNQLEKGK